MVEKVDWRIKENHGFSPAKLEELAEKIYEKVMEAELTNSESTGFMDTATDNVYIEGELRDDKLYVTRLGIPHNIRGTTAIIYSDGEVELYDSPQRAKIVIFNDEYREKLRGWAEEIIGMYPKINGAELL